MSCSWVLRRARRRCHIHLQCVQRPISALRRRQLSGCWWHMCWLQSGIVAWLIRTRPAHHITNSWRQSSGHLGNWYSWVTIRCWNRRCRLHLRTLVGTCKPGFQCTNHSRHHIDVSEHQEDCSGVVRDCYQTLAAFRVTCHHCRRVHQMTLMTWWCWPDGQGHHRWAWQDRPTQAMRLSSFKAIMK